MPIPPTAKAKGILGIKTMKDYLKQLTLRLFIPSVIVFGILAAAMPYIIKELPTLVDTIPLTTIQAGIEPSESQMVRQLTLSY